MDAEIQFIGYISSELKEIKDCPLQENENAPAASLIIYPEFQPAATNLKQGDEIIVFTWLHLAERAILKTKPRNNPAAPLTGIFSTRSPDRPNPIGMHLVKIISVIPGGNLEISGIEALDGTPVVDLKPVI